MPTPSAVAFSSSSSSFDSCDSFEDGGAELKAAIFSFELLRMRSLSLEVSSYSSWLLVAAVVVVAVATGPETAFRIRRRRRLRRGGSGGWL